MPISWRALKKQNRKKKAKIKSKQMKNMQIWKNTKPDRAGNRNTFLYFSPQNENGKWQMTIYVHKCTICIKNVHSSQILMMFAQIFNAFGQGRR